MEYRERICQAKITRRVVETKAEILDRKWEVFQPLHEQIGENATKEDLSAPYLKTDVYSLTEDAYAINKGQFEDYLRQLMDESEAVQQPAPTVMNGHSITE